MKPIKLAKAAATALLCLTGVSLAVSAQAATTLRLSTYVNESDIRFEGFKKFAELAEQKTAGRLKVQIFPSATLHG